MLVPPAAYAHRSVKFSARKAQVTGGEGGRRRLEVKMNGWCVVGREEGKVGGEVWGMRGREEGREGRRMGRKELDVPQRSRRVSVQTQDH